MTNKRAKYQKIKLRHEFRWFMAMFFILIISVIGIITINLYKLQIETDKIAKNYVTDVTSSTAENARLRLRMTKQQMESIADSLVRISSVDRKYNLLQRKQKILEFRMMGIAGKDGVVTFVDRSTQDISKEVCFKSALNGENNIYEFGNNEVVYTKAYQDPVYGKCVLVAVRSKSYMQKLVRGIGFEGKGEACVSDSNGKMVVTSANKPLYRKLRSYLEKKEEKSISEYIEKKLENNQSAIVDIGEIEGYDYMLAMTKMGVKDWSLITLIRSDLIFSKISSTFFATFVSVAGVTVLLLTGAAYIVWVMKQNQKALEILAFIDPVTGKMNNNRFKMICAELFRKSEPGTYTIVVMNIRNFRIINKKYGVEGGDQVLQYVLSVIEKNLREDEIASRDVADHFYICLKESDEEKIKERLIQLICKINMIKGLHEFYRFSIEFGAYQVYDRNLDMDTIQDRADMAYKYKKQGVADILRFYDESLIKELEKEKELHDLLEESLKNGDFKAYLQPKISLNDGKIAGAEALIRWQHPKKGMIYPSEFIPIFEKSGEILKLDQFVFEEVCRFMQYLRKEGRTLFPVSVNLSRDHFQNENFLKPFLKIRENYQIPAQLLEFEVTESIFAADQEMEKAITQIHKEGFLCSMDDFGSGYSSLGMLIDFDIDYIKIDKSFFDRMDMDEKGQKVIESVVRLSKELNIGTVAEGVEDPKQVEFLKKVQCDVVQGYVYAKPLALDEFMIWMDQRTSF